MKINQAGAGFHGDKRTKRNRDRSNNERQIIEQELEDADDAERLDP